MESLRKTVGGFGGVQGARKRKRLSHLFGGDRVQGGAGGGMEETLHRCGGAGQEVGDQDLPQREGQVPCARGRGASAPSLEPSRCSFLFFFQVRVVTALLASLGWRLALAQDQGWQPGEKVSSENSHFSDSSKQ